MDFDWLRYRPSRGNDTRKPIRRTHSFPVFGIQLNLLRPDAAEKLFLLGREGCLD